MMCEIWRANRNRFVPTKIVLAMQVALPAAISNAKISCNYTIWSKNTQQTLLAFGFRRDYTRWISEAIPNSQHTKWLIILIPKCRVTAQPEQKRTRQTALFYFLCILISVYHLARILWVWLLHLILPSAYSFYVRYVLILYVRNHRSYQCSHHSSSAIEHSTNIQSP